MKLANAELPKIKREGAAKLDPKVLQEAVNDLQGSLDFAPHAYTDGKQYDKYSEALSAANLTIRDVADASGRPRNMLRRKVWSTTGEKDRKKKSKWVFAVTWRSSEPKPRKPKQTPQPVAA